jgi:hypothetical protein
MRGWPDVAAIADELTQIAGGTRELEERSRRARAAGDAEANAGARAPYEDVRAAVRPPPEAATLREIYHAACRAMSVDPRPTPTPVPAPAAASALDRLLRFVSRA